MSDVKINKALEIRVAALAPPLATAWENLEFSPVSGVPYQECWVMMAKPENPTLGDGFYRQRGILQISLYYPVNKGKADARARGDLLRTWFKRGLSLQQEGVTVKVEETPEIGTGSTEGDRYKVVIRVRFYSDIFA